MREVITRVAIALVVLAAGMFGIYLFIAGYLSSFGAWLPRPWNLLVGLVLALMLIALVASIVVSNRTKNRKHTRETPSPS
jgi:hypothetical protein